MRIVQVPLGNRSYKIEVARDLLEQLGPKLASHNLGRNGVIITDTAVAPLYAQRAIQSLESAGFTSAVVTIPSGEPAKSLKIVQNCYDELAARRLERKSFVIALGGGVVGDLAGFVAATYLRGIPFIQVPTTLLAQVDSSVGGKVGVNLKAGKNLVGAFYQPKHVFCDLATLDSLPAREFRAGLAEVIKYGIIFDADLFNRLERNYELVLDRDPAIMADIVARCCEIKAEVVGQDETESGVRAILNFGHTIGHALEAISSYGKYLHGEAISLGQVAAAYISHKRLSLSEEELLRIRNLFATVGLPVQVKLTGAQRKKLFDAMSLDKKVQGGDVKFVLATHIGQVQFGMNVPPDQIEAALDYLAEGPKQAPAEPGLP